MGKEFLSSDTAEYDQSHSQALDILRGANGHSFFVIVVEKNEPVEERYTEMETRVFQIVQGSEMLTVLSALLLSTQRLLKDCVRAGLIRSQLDILALMIGTEETDIT